MSARNLIEQNLSNRDIIRVVHRAQAMYMDGPKSKTIRSWPPLISPNPPTSSATEPRRRRTMPRRALAGLRHEFSDNATHIGVSSPTQVDQRPRAPRPLSAAASTPRQL